MSTTYRTAVILGGLTALFALLLMSAQFAFAQLGDTSTTSDATTTPTSTEPSTTATSTPAATTTPDVEDTAPSEPALTTEEQLRARIAELEAENARLRSQLAALEGGTSIQDLTQLQEGDSGEAVRELQSLLAAIPGIYPEGLTTGYYGPLTEQAVMRFQTQQGLQPTGIADPETIVELLRVSQQSGSMQGTGTSTPQVAPPTSPGASAGGITLCHIPGGNTSQAQTIQVSVAALQTHLAHGDLPFPCESIDFDELDRQLENLRDTGTTTDDATSTDNDDNDRNADDSDDDTSTSTDDNDNATSTNEDNTDDDDANATSTDES